jgi:hypothetical protein
MKVWISRNRIKFSDEVCIHLSEPNNLKGTFFGDDMVVEFSLDNFKRAFKFVPKKGTCKEHELTLK